MVEEDTACPDVLVQIAESNEVRTGRQIDLGVRLLEPLMLMVMARLTVVILLSLLFLELQKSVFPKSMDRIGIEKTGLGSRATY